MLPFLHREVHECFKMVQPLHQSKSILPWWILWKVDKLSKARSSRLSKLLRRSPLSDRKDWFIKQKSCNIGKFIKRKTIPVGWTWNARIYKFQQKSNYIRACNAMQNTGFRRKKQKALQWTERLNSCWSVCENEETSIFSGSNITLKRKENHWRHTQWILWGGYAV